MLCVICNSSGELGPEGTCGKCLPPHNGFYTSQDLDGSGRWSVYSEREVEIDGDFRQIDGTERRIISLGSAVEADVLANSLYNQYKHAEGTPWL